MESAFKVQVYMIIQKHRICGILIDEYETVLVLYPGHCVQIRKSP